MTGTDLFLLVLGWIFVIEGLSPLINPVGWQRMLAHLAEVPPYSLEYFQLMVALGVIGGSDGKLDANGPLTRAAVCKILATLP